MTTKEVTLDAPLALQNLIAANNQLLRDYQAKLLQQVEEANIQLMQILQLQPSEGWRFDIDRMVYVRHISVEETEESDGATDTE